MAEKQNPFKRVAIMGRRRASRIPETVIALRDFLQSLAVQTVLEKHTGLAINETQLPLIEPEDLAKHADLILLVGGDGSMINAAHVAISQHLPVLGINRGRVGFLTDIHPSEFDKIAAVLSGHYSQESRTLLSTDIHTKDKAILTSRIALNDVVLSCGVATHMMDFDIHVDSDFMATQRADGLIVATPTGSTAYSLSAGGPIINPKINAVSLVPMFPHTLSSRPIILPGGCVIDIHVLPQIDISPQISCDGQEKFDVPIDAHITIRQLPEQLMLIHPQDYKYFETLRMKLGWHHYKKRS